MIKTHLLGPVQHITEDLFIREVILTVRWESKWEFFLLNSEDDIVQQLAATVCWELVRLLQFDWVL